jgi:hypothetical protein
VGTLHEDSSTTSELTIGVWFCAVTIRLHTGTGSGGGGGGGADHVTWMLAGALMPPELPATTL